MIELFEGLPGAGKTHEAIRQRLVPSVDGTAPPRRCLVRLNGIAHRTWSLILKIPEAVLRERLVLLSEADVLKLPQLAEVGDFIVVDECQSFWRAGDKVDPEILKWLETHRHKGQDVLLICQRWDQVASGITRLVEMTTLFRKARRFGFDATFQAWERGTPREKETWHHYVGQYEPKICALYASYVNRGVEEQTVRGGLIWRNPFLIAAGLFGLVALVAFFSRPGLEAYAQKPLPVQPPQTSTAPSRTPEQIHRMPGPPMAGLRGAEPGAGLPAPAPLVIVGQVGYADGSHWWFELADGRLVPLEELQALVGQPTTWRQVRPGEWQLLGEGVRYGRAVGSDADSGDRPGRVGLLPLGPGRGTGAEDADVSGGGGVRTPP